MNFSLSADFLARFKHKKELSKLKVMCTLDAELDTTFNDMLKFLINEVQNSANFIPTPPSLLSEKTLPTTNIQIAPSAQGGKEVGPDASVFTTPTQPLPPTPPLTSDSAASLSSGSSSVSVEELLTSSELLASDGNSNNNGSQQDDNEIDILSLLGGQDSNDSFDTLDSNFSIVPSKRPKEHTKDDMDEELLLSPTRKKTRMVITSTINSETEQVIEKDSLNAINTKSKKSKILSKIEIPKADNCVLVCTHEPICPPSIKYDDKLHPNKEEKSLRNDRRSSHSPSNRSSNKKKYRKHRSRRNSHRKRDQEILPMIPSKTTSLAPVQSNVMESLNKGKRIVLLSSKRRKMNREMQTNPNNSNILSGAYDVCIRRLKCLHDDCSVDFESKAMHEQHMRESHNSFAELCPLASCNGSFQDKNHWSRHVQVEHPNVTRWQCAKCSTVWASPDLLYGHNVLCHVEGLYECLHPGCDFASRIRRPVIDHYEQTHLYEELGHMNMDEIDGLHLDKYYTLRTICPRPECQRVLTDKGEYQKHLYKGHGIKYNQCMQCNDSFNERKGLARHIRKEHADMNNEWQCKECGNLFRNHPTLFTHNFLCHFEGEFKCAADGCEFVENTRANVIHHYDQSHPKIICRLSLSDLKFVSNRAAMRQSISSNPDEDLLDTEDSAFEAPYHTSSASPSLSSHSPLFNRSIINSSLENLFSLPGGEDPSLFQITITNGRKFSTPASGGGYDFSSPSSSSLTSLYQRRFENVRF